jgi:putative ABC transport system ATP-binding protein
MSLVSYERVNLVRGSKTILSDVSFSVDEGERVVFRGRSGSGKSTILKCLLGVHCPQRGRILYAGEPLDRETVQKVRTSAAYIGQEPVMGAETVRQALLLPFRFKAHRGREPSEAALAQTLEALRLPEELLARECSRVSGGEKQRIALARALLLGKSLYLLDEITSALDPESKQAVIAALSRPGLTLLSVAHDPDWIAWCNTVYELEEGRLAREERHGHD